MALKHAIDVGMDRAFPLAVIVAAIVVTVDAMRIVRVSRKDRIVLRSGVVC